MVRKLLGGLMALRIDRQNFMNDGSRTEAAFEYAQEIEEKLRAAVSIGSVFLVPQSLYRSFQESRTKLVANPYPPTDLSKVKLPFPSCVIVEIGDANSQDRNGKPTALVVAYEDAAGNIHADSIGLLHHHVDRIATYLPGMDMRGRPLCSYSSAMVAIMDSLLKPKHAAHTQPIAGMRPREARAARQANKAIYTGRFTELSPYARVPSSTTGNGGVVAAHWVRGHFKNRATGTYWWSAYIAGAGELQQRSGYNLT